MTTEPPLVTVLIPARNEASDIERCLEHVLAQDHPLDRMEVIVVDGGSTDGTGELARRALDGSGLFRWVVHPNPAGTTPSNLNAGLALAAGEVVCRVDARSLIPPDYVRWCAEVLRARPDVAVVGGAQVAQARDGSTRALGIARALNNRFAMGGSRYRGAAGSGPSDTVYLGAFRTEELRDEGGWDVRLGTNQDFDLNRRLSARGLVWFEDGLRVGYTPRSTLVDLWHQYRRFGEGKVRYWTLADDAPRPRQLLLLTVPVVASVAGLAVFARLGWRGRAGALAVCTVAITAAEVRGSSGPVAPTSAHVVAMATSGVIAAAWIRGVWGALAARLVGRDLVGAARGASR